MTIKGRIRKFFLDSLGINNILSDQNFGSLFPDGFNLFSSQQSGSVLNDPTLFSVITRLSNTIASLPINLYDKNGNVQNKDPVRNIVATSPNQDTTAFELWNKAEAYKNIYGNAFILIVLDNFGRISHLYNIPNGEVSILRDTDSGAIWYQISNNAYVGNTVVPSSLMIHLKHLVTPHIGQESILGISPINVLTNSSEYNDKVRDFSLNEMSKRDGFTVSAEGKLSPENQANLSKQIAQFINQSGGVLFSDQSAKVDLIDRKVSLSDAVDNDLVYNRRIANVYNLPMSFVNESTDSSGYKSNEQLMIQFVSMTVTPIIRQNEALLNNRLLNDSKHAGWYFKFDVHPLLMADTAARTAYYQSMTRNGKITTNEARSMEGLPKSTDPNADKLFISKDLIPLSATMTNTPGNDPNQKGGNQ